MSLRGLAPLLGYLRTLGVAPVPAAGRGVGSLDVLVERYRRYLVTERGLVATTVRYYLPDARVFLARGSTVRVAAGRAGCGQVIGFVVEQCARRSVGSAKMLVTVLRSLLRFLLWTGRSQLI